MSKFLILRFSSIGDIVLCSPLLRCLKIQQKDAEIHFATKERFEPILNNNPHISKIHVLSESDKSLIERLKQENFDFIIDLHNNLRSLRIKNALDVKAYSFPKLNLEKWLLVNLKINRLPKVHIVNRYFETLKDFSVIYDDKGLDFFVDEPAALEELNREDSVQNNKYIAIAIGANWTTKQIPKERIRSFIANSNAHFVLLGDKSDNQRVQDIVNDKSLNSRVSNLCGKVKLNTSAFVLKNAEKVITGDTGLMHIAAAFNVPICSIWGSTVPAFGMEALFPSLASKKEDSLLIQNTSLSCRPCSKLGHNKCPKRHFKCMNELNYAEIERWIST